VTEIVEVEVEVPGETITVTSIVTEVVTEVVTETVEVEVTAPPPPPVPLSEAKVRWAGFGGMAELLFFIAEDAGFFEAEGLELERIELGGGVDLFSALASGSVAFTQLGTQHGIRAVTRGLDFRGIFGFSHGPNEFGVISPEAAAAAGITQDSTLDEKFEALRGLKIGTGRPGSTTTTLAIGAMEQRGIDTTSEVELVPLGRGSALLPAFQAREIDAFFWIPPETQIAALEPGAVTIDFRVLPELEAVNWASYFTTDSYILEHPDTVQAFLRAVLNAREWALANEDDAREIARARFPDLEEAAFASSFQIDYDSLKPSILFSEDGFEKGRYILNLGLPADDPNTTLMTAVVTNELVIQAATELGIPIG
ncbi:MAG: ABC transporter substrate-binding protein, partial [Acidimicrobiia bacterium]|nr:ABC transporter substrate-binding protein [Acidimicrobiia bacterium]